MRKLIKTAVAAVALGGASLAAVQPAQANGTGAAIFAGIVGLGVGAAIASSDHPRRARYDSGYGNAYYGGGNGYYGGGYVQPGYGVAYDGYRNDGYHRGWDQDRRGGDNWERHRDRDDRDHDRGYDRDYRR